MLDDSIFIGFMITPSFQKKLDQANPHLINLLIDNGDKYLEHLKQDDQEFLGRKLQGVQELDSILLISDNVRSLLEKLTEDYSFEEKIKIFTLREFL